VSTSEGIVCMERGQSLRVMKRSILVGAMALILIGCSRSEEAISGHSSLRSRTVPQEPPAPALELRDQTKEGCPPELLAQARAAATGDLTRVRDYRRPWTSARLYTFWTEEGKYLKFMRMGDTYVQINSPSGIGALSDLLGEYRFTRGDFADPEEVHWFLHEVLALYGNSRGAQVGSSVMLRITERDGGVALWLEGTEKSEAAFLELCRDPEFSFDGNQWDVGFHVFQQGGSVERWEVKGEFDSENECNRIHAIDITLVKPEGTFYHEIMG